MKMKMMGGDVEQDGGKKKKIVKQVKKINK